MDISAKQLFRLDKIREALSKFQPKTGSSPRQEGQSEQGLDARAQGFNLGIAQIRKIGEHPFRILKGQLGYTKVRQRELYIRTPHNCFTLFASGNLFQADSGGKTA